MSRHAAAMATYIRSINLLMIQGLRGIVQRLYPPVHIGQAIYRPSFQGLSYLVAVAFKGDTVMWPAYSTPDANRQIKKRERRRNNIHVVSFTILLVCGIT